MLTVNRFGEPVHRTMFPTWAKASAFARMIASNCARFSLLGVIADDTQWAVTYRSRKACPWKRDARATRGVPQS